MAGPKYQQPSTDGFQPGDRLLDPTRPPRGVLEMGPDGNWVQTSTNSPGEETTLQRMPLSEYQSAMGAQANLNQAASYGHPQENEEDIEWATSPTPGTPFETNPHSANTAAQITTDMWRAPSPHANSDPKKRFLDSVKTKARGNMAQEMRKSLAPVPQPVPPLPTPQTREPAATAPTEPGLEDLEAALGSFPAEDVVAGSRPLVSDPGDGDGPAPPPPPPVALAGVEDLDEDELQRLLAGA